MEYPCSFKRAPYSAQDVSGIWDYEGFVRTITRPRHRKNKAILTWHGCPYDPEGISEAEIVTTLGKLARRQTLGQAA